MKWVLIGLLVVVALVAAVFVVGLLRPAGHVASVRAELSAPPERVWETVADFESWGEWVPDVDRMERRPDRDGNQIWLTVGEWGELPTEVQVWEPPRRLKTYVDGGAFRGYWTFEIEAAGEGSRVTVTEEGWVDNPLFRAMMIFHDNYASATAYLRALGARLGEEEVVPVQVR